MTFDPMKRPVDLSNMKKLVPACPAHREIFIMPGFDGGPVIEVEHRITMQTHISTVCIVQTNQFLKALGLFDDWPWIREEFLRLNVQSMFFEGVRWNSTVELIDMAMIILNMRTDRIDHTTEEGQQALATLSLSGLRLSTLINEVSQHEREAIKDHFANSLRLLNPGA